VNVHIVNHVIVGIGAVLLFIAAFFGHYRRAPLRVRILLLLTGPVGAGWTIVGIYLIQHTTAQGHTTLPWSQFWTLSHQIESRRIWNWHFNRTFGKSGVLQT